jgi:hypothetical protein
LSKHTASAPPSSSVETSSTTAVESACVLIIVAIAVQELERGVCLGELCKVVRPEGELGRPAQPIQMLTWTTLAVMLQ